MSAQNLEKFQEAEAEVEPKTNSEAGRQSGLKD